MNNKVYARDLAHLLILNQERTMVIIGSKQSVAKELLQDIREELLTTPWNAIFQTKLTLDNKTQLRLDNR